MATSRQGVDDYLFERLGDGVEENGAKAGVYLYRCIVAFTGENDFGVGVA
jgi:hypothetical protein